MWHVLVWVGWGGEVPPESHCPRQNYSLLLVRVPHFPSLKAKCSASKSSSFSDSLFQIKGFKLTYDHVST